MKKSLQTALVVSLVTAAVQAHAGLIGYSSSGGSPVLDPGFNVGTEFFVTQSLQVDSLGVFDDNGNGLNFAREVDLWHVTGPTTGTLLASVIVPAGTLGTLAGGFRFAPITAVSLTPGQAYRVSTVYDSNFPGDPYDWLPAGSPPPLMQTPGANVTLSGGSYYSVSDTATFPDTSDFDERSAANFTTVSAVPEPSAVVTGLLCVGVAAFGVRRKYLARSK